MSFICDGLNLINSNNYILQFLGAYAIYEIIKGLSTELSELIFKNDVIYLSIFNGEFNISRFMKHIFIAGLIILLIVLYNNNVSNNKNKNNTKNITNNNKETFINPKKHKKTTQIKFIKK